MLKRILVRTRAELETELSTLARAAQTHDLREVERAAHRTAGHAAMIGAHLVARRARVLESNAHAERLEPHELERAIDALRRGFRLAERVLSELAEHTVGQEPESP